MVQSGVEGIYALVPGIQILTLTIGRRTTPLVRSIERHGGGRSPHRGKVNLRNLLPGSSYSLHCAIGDRLYAAQTLYGQAIADFCEQAVRMRQFVDRGEPWDMANGV
jgi:hypothetical protein